MYYTSAQPALLFFNYPDGFSSVRLPLLLLPIAFLTGSNAAWWKNVPIEIGAHGANDDEFLGAVLWNIKSVEERLAVFPAPNSAYLRPILTTPLPGSAAYTAYFCRLLILCC